MALGRIHWCQLEDACVLPWCFRPFRHCSGPTHHKPIVPNRILSLMVNFPTPLRPYEHGLAEACGQHVINLNSILHRSHDCRKFSSRLEHSASAFRVYRSLRMMKISKPQAILGDQSLLSSVVRLIFPASLAWQSCLSKQGGSAVTFFQHD